MSGPLPFSALFVQPIDTTCSLPRPPPPMRSALPSRGGGGGADAAPCGFPIYSRTTPRYTNNPYTPDQPLLEVHSRPAYPAYCVSEPRYGLPPPYPPPSPLPVTPPPDQQNPELAGHVAGLDRRSENPAPPRWQRNQRTRPLDQNPAKWRLEGTPRRPKRRRHTRQNPGTIAAPFRPPRRQGDPRSTFTGGPPPFPQRGH